MYHETFDTARGAGTPRADDRRDDVRHFLLVPQSPSLSYAADTFAEVLSCANRLVGQTPLSWTRLPGLAALADAPSHGGGRRTGIVLIGGTEEAWRPAPEELTPLRSRLLSAPRLCTAGAGVFVALMAGRLGGVSLSVHPGFQPAVMELAPDVIFSARAVSHSGRFSTAISALAAPAMALDLVSRKLGGFTGQAVAEYLGLRVPHQHNRSVEHWRLMRKSKGNPLIGRALTVMLDHLEEVLTVTEIAEIVGISPRQLERRFRTTLDRSPLQVYRNLRLERARSLLVQTGLPIREIALASGFGTTSALTRWYREEYGESPGRARSRAFDGTCR